MKKCGMELKRWSRNHFGNVRKELAKKRRLLVEAKKEAMQSGQNHRVRELKKEKNEVTNKKRRMWFQRSKVLWATNGDKNSKFFHSWATQRKRKNSIKKIRDESGNWTTNTEQVFECLIKYYQDLFTSAQSHLHGAATNSIQTIISVEMNAQLSSKFKA